MSVQIRRVETKRDLKTFIDFRTELYRNDPAAVPYLYMDEMSTLNKKKNPAFRFCEAEYFMAYRDGKPVGRVAAIINNRANETWNKKNVRFGFFDFIDDMEVSTALMNQVKKYGQEKGMDTIIGPMGFTDMDREGMLVDGFDKLASMHGNHNYAYYPQHMERMGGFEKDNDWIQLLINMPSDVPPKLKKVSTMIQKRYNLNYHKLTKHQLLKEGYAQRLFEIVNECYKDLYEYSKLDEVQIERLVTDYLEIADTNLLSFVFDDNKEGLDALVGFGISFPSFSRALQKTGNGKLFPFGWWHLLRTIKFHNTDTVDLLLIGVLPEYRAKGANALIFDDLIGWYLKYGFKYALTLAMMETNEGVLSAWQYFDKEIVKRLRSYKAPL